MTNALLNMLRGALVCVLFCLPNVSAAGPMSSAEIQTEVIHRAFVYKGREGGQTVEGGIVYRKDNVILIRTKQGYTDGGTWRIVDDALCTKITLLRAAEELCFRIERKGRGYRTSHGFRLTPADSQRFQGA